MDLKNKKILITGASSGIGYACAKAFAAHAPELYLVARREDRLLSLRNKLAEQYEAHSNIITLDITDQKEVENHLSNLQDIDILVNNAGLALGTDKVYEANYNDWQQMYNTNVLGLLKVTHTLLPKMVERNTGHIINIGSISSHEVYPGGAIYCSTKHAERAITKGLKLDLTGKNIRVTSIDPGMVETEFSKVRFQDDLEKANSVYAGMTPLSPDDVADAVVYAATRPSHVNISEIILMPTDQSSTTHINKTGVNNGTN